MLEKFNALVKELNATKPIDGLPDWSVRIGSIYHGYNNHIELENAWIGTFFFTHYLGVNNNEISNVVVYDFCCEFKDCSLDKINYRQTLATRFKELFPGE